MNYILALVLLLLNSLVFAGNFQLTSASLDANGFISPQYTCQGNNTPLNLHWQNAPIQTKTFALIVTDPDAPNGVWYHWIVYNIPADVMELSALKPLPQQAEELANSWGKKQYGGPCPPKGKVHHYHFTLYAVDRVLQVSNLEELTAQLAKHSLASTILVAKYQSQ